MLGICHPESSEGAGGPPIVKRSRAGSLAALGMTASFSFLCTIASAQQSNAERILSGRDTPSHDYDLIHQRIEVANFDWNATAFDGNVITTVVALRPGLDSVVLAMGRRLAVRSVTGSAKGAPLQFTRPGDSIVVRLPRPALFRDTVRFTIDYRGRIEQGRGLYFFRAEPGRPRHPQQVYSGGGTDGNPNWIPTYAAPNDKATWELVARVPADLTVVSNGQLVSDRPDPSARGARAGPARARTHTVHWRQERPASTYLISLVAAPFKKVSDRWHDVPLDFYVYPEDVAQARRLFGVTPDMMETFAKLTGVKYPWPKYSQATVTDFVGGMENVGATTLVDWLPDARAYHDRPWYRQSLIPHELAHQWFGNLVTTENWSNYWLNEGMAEFMAGQYWATRQGRHAEDDFYLDEYNRFLAAESRRSVPLASFNSNNVYTKGALVMQMLKKHLGPERFWASINRYLTRHAYGNATSDDLRRAVLHATGQNLDWFWDQWIYKAGYPQFTVAHSYDSTAGSLALTVRQTQVDTARADSGGVRFVTPLVFQGPVTIRVGTAAGDVRKRVRLDQREQVILIDGLKSRPNMVVFDENNAMLKALTFEQPTPWLANQLARDPDLWNRNWVIGQLAHRTSDSLAGSALARAARSADYYLTRAQALAALSQFPAAMAMPVLETAMHDTSAVVRAVAMSGFGALGGPRSQEAALAAWKRDSSYEVRANALIALSRIDSVGSRRQVLAGLSTPSYRDVIQNAAIAAVRQAPDSTLIDGLEKILGDQEEAAIVLATLASQGDTRALTTLVRHRDDPRPWVRRWVLDAIEQQLEKTP